MYGIDISDYQKRIDLSEPKLDFCIFKVTEGKTLEMSTIDNFRNQLVNNNKLMGFYHFARPDINNSEALMELEADFFIEILKNHNLLGKGIICIDWEPTKNATNNKLLRALILRIQSQTGLHPFLYVTPYLWSKLKSTIDETNTPIWLAQWGTNKYYKFGEYPSITEYAKLEENYYAIWQYSSNGLYPGWAGRVDLDFSPLTRAEWELYSTQIIKESIPSDVEWAVKMGLLKGFSDGTIRPYDTVTRSQLATVCKRLHDLLS